jgi:hypothetical protein
MQMPMSVYESFGAIISTEFVAEEFPVWGTPSLHSPFKVGRGLRQNAQHTLMPPTGIFIGPP